MGDEAGGAAGAGAGSGAGGWVGASPQAARYAALFAAEARDQLQAATDALLALERSAAAGTPNEGAVDAAFRAVHTVKGMSATMGYAVVERVAHAVEHVLGRVRGGLRAVDGALVDALLGAGDALEGGVEAAVAGVEAPDVSEALETLRRVDARADSPGSGEGAAVGRSTGAVQVRVTITPGAPLPGVRAFMALQRARALGAIDEVHPPEDDFRRDGFDGAFHFRLVPSAATSPDAIGRAIRLAGDIASVVVAPDLPAAAGRADKAGAAADEVRERTSGAEPGVTAPASGARRTVRLDAARLDALLDLVGELVAARGRLTSAASRVGDAAVASAVADVGRLTAALHDQIVESRLVPVAEAFDRMPRLVRDAARATGKRVELETSGGEVGVDRTVLDALAEPLGHLLRNAVDHGLEAPPARRGAGKPECGRVALRAVRERDAIAVAVEDDGRGIDRGVVRLRAIERGVLPADAPPLDDDRLLRVLATPGFSTADRVTAVSGRGVGLDAVLARVRALGGDLRLRTTPGAGTTWTLRLPLTLAVARALVALDGDAAWALPLTHVRETLDLADARAVDDAGRPAVRVRDALLPLVPLRAAVTGDTAGASPDGWGAALDACAEAAVVEVGGRRLALGVAALAGQPDLVVKPLPRVRGTFRIFGGASILDTGAVALVLDVPALLSRISP